MWTVYVNCGRHYRVYGSFYDIVLKETLDHYYSNTICGNIILTTIALQYVITLKTN